MGEPLRNVDPLRTLRELFAPITTNTPSCIMLPATNATHFDLKPNVIQILPTFNGLENEDPYVHVKEFLERCNTFEFQNFSDESLRLRLFPFSLHGKAKAWLHSNLPESITSWEILLTKFYNKFFPISRINEFRRKISTFCQEEDEKFCDSWERFKELTMKCPPHGFETWRLIQFFYNGLTQPERYMIESMNGGGFLNLTGEEAYKTLDELSDNSQRWDFSSRRGKCSTTTKNEGLYEVKDNEDIKGKLKDLMRTVEALALNKPVTTANIYQAEVNAFNDYRKPTSGPLAETYNPGWRNHPNFSWKQNQPQNQGRTSNQAHTQYSSRFPSQAQNQFQSSHQAQPAPQLSLEETLQAFIQTSNQNIQQHSQNIQELQKVTMNNNQIMQELKNVTLSNSQTIQELKNEFMDSKQFTH
ncbi:uncharacterized protein LOC133868150 [Alnus glutinosa]|uniref:uncharacterized protein LOC133868150 n=1 Tax=Alnus glutinosa TaxID=3517 RepID=UPI002D7755A9|nr:uncharacterized protein LOC133868150 [Alnus glutinosa]